MDSHKKGRESVRDDEMCGRSKEVNTPELIGQRLGLGFDKKDRAVKGGRERERKRERERAGRRGAKLGKTNRIKKG